MVGFVIGRGGETIKMLQVVLFVFHTYRSCLSSYFPPQKAQTGAHIQVVKDEFSDPNARERFVDLGGSAAQVQIVLLLCLFFEQASHLFSLGL